MTDRMLALTYLGACPMLQDVTGFVRNSPGCSLESLGPQVREGLWRIYEKIPVDPWYAETLFGFSVLNPVGAA